MSKYCIVMKIHPIWSICVITRACLAYIVYRFGNMNKRIRYGLTILLSVMGGGFMYKGYTGSNNEKQIAPVFWHDTRYIHGSLYILAALSLINGNPINSSGLIISDIAFSIIYRVMSGQ
jgi:hypothetical protein